MQKDHLEIQHDREYEIKLGESFNTDNAGVSYHYMIYDFVPASADFSKEGTIHTTTDPSSGPIEVEIKNRQGQNAVAMNGHRAASKDYALIFDGQSFWLEKLSSATLLKKEETKKPSQSNAKASTSAAPVPRGKAPLVGSAPPPQPAPAAAAPPSGKLRIQLQTPSASNISHHHHHHNHTTASSSSSSMATAAAASSMQDAPLTPNSSRRATRTSQAAASATSSSAAAAVSHQMDSDNPFPEADPSTSVHNYDPFGSELSGASQPIDADMESSSDSDSSSSDSDS